MLIKLKTTGLVLVLAILFAKTDVRAGEIHRAAYKGNTYRISNLLARGHRVDETDRTGGTALMWAALHSRSPKTVKFLLGRGANPNRKTYKGDTALLGAVLGRNVEIAKLLLAAGADVNAQAFEDRTGLVIASITVNYPMVKLLIDYGARIDLRDSSGKTALDYTRNPVSGPSAKADLIKITAIINAKGRKLRLAELHKRVIPLPVRRPISVQERPANKLANINRVPSLQQSVTTNANPQIVASKGIKMIWLAVFFALLPIGVVANFLYKRKMELWRAEARAAQERTRQELLKRYTQVGQQTRSAGDQEIVLVNNKINFTSEITLCNDQYHVVRPMISWVWNTQPGTTLYIYRNTGTLLDSAQAVVGLSKEENGECICVHIEHDKTTGFYVDGGAETGQTYNYYVLLTFTRDKHRPVILDQDGKQVDQAAIQTSRHPELFRVSTVTNSETFYSAKIHSRRITVLETFDELTGQEKDLDIQERKLNLLDRETKLLGRAKAMNEAHAAPTLEKNPVNAIAARVIANLQEQTELEKAIDTAKQEMSDSGVPEEDIEQAVDEIHKRVAGQR